MKSRRRSSRTWSAVSSRSPAHDAWATMRRSNGSCRVSSGNSRIASVCSAVILSSSRPWTVSLLLRSAGTESLPSMVLMVSSHTVAAETCTPCADVIACRARGPRRGLSSSSHSSAWLSRSSIAAGLAVVIGFAGFIWLAVFRAVEHLLDVRIDAECLIVVGDLVLQPAERHCRRVVRHQIRDWGAGLRDHHPLAGRDLLQKTRQMRLCLVDVDAHSHAYHGSDQTKFSPVVWTRADEEIFPC